MLFISALRCSDYAYIGGFIFLRLFCPAIVSPLRYRLISGGATGKSNLICVCCDKKELGGLTRLITIEGGGLVKVQKTLILITKILQKAANNSTFAKNMTLHNLNPIIQSNHNAISKFLKELSETSWPDTISQSANCVFCTEWRVCVFVCVAFAYFLCCYADVDTFFTTRT